MNPFKPARIHGQTDIQKYQDDQRCKRLGRRWGYAAFVAHSLAIIGFSSLVYVELLKSPEASMLWILWLAIDFPVSLGVIPLEGTAKNFWFDQGFHFSFFYSFVFGSYFLLLGGIQYFVITRWAVVWICKKRNNRHDAASLETATSPSAASEDSSTL